MTPKMGQLNGPLCKEETRFSRLHFLCEFCQNGKFLFFKPTRSNAFLDSHDLFQTTFFISVLFILESLKTNALFTAQNKKAFSKDIFRISVVEPHHFHAARAGSGSYFTIY
jgi:long-subunit acyl-CoA synthetase (AMP-forming)